MIIINQKAINMLQQKKTSYFRSIAVLVMLSISFSSASTVFAVIPQSMSYTAVLRDSAGVAIVGTNDFKVRYYDASSSGVLMYEEEFLATTINSGGTFFLPLGTGSIVSGTFGSINFNSPVFITLNTRVNLAPSYDGEMTPRIPLRSVPFALNSQKLDGRVVGGANGIVAYDASSSIAVNNLTASGTIISTLINSLTGIFNSLFLNNVATGTATSTILTRDTTTGQVTQRSLADIFSSVSCSLSLSIFCQDGNSFGAVAKLGTNDANNLILKTNGIDQVTLTATGTLFTNSILPNGPYTGNVATGQNLGASNKRWDYGYINNLIVGPASYFIQDVAGRLEFRSASSPNPAFVIDPTFGGYLNGNSQINRQIGYPAPNLLFNENPILGTDVVGFKAPNSINASYVMTLPGTPALSPGQVMVNDGLGNLSWVNLLSTATDTNFGNTDLIATGDRTHDFGGYNLDIVNATNIGLISNFSGSIGSNSGFGSGASYQFTGTNGTIRSINQNVGLFAELNTTIDDVELVALDQNNGQGARLKLDRTDLTFSNNITSLIPLNVNSGGDIKLGGYANTRIDTPAPLNFLYTGALGELLSAPISSLGITGTTTNSLLFASTTNTLVSIVNGIVATTSVSGFLSPITIQNSDSLFATGLSTPSGFGATNANDSNFFGAAAGYQAINANNSNFMGNGAGNAAVNANNSIFLGQQAGQTAINANNSIFLGQATGDGATNANNSIFLGKGAGFNDTVNNSAGDTSILIGDNTSTGGFSNSIALGKNAVNTKTNQFTIGPAYTDFSFRGVNYTMPSAQGATGTVLTNTGGGILSWVSGGAGTSTSPITVQNSSSLFATGLPSPSGVNSLASNSIFLGNNAGVNAINANNSNFFGTSAGSSAANAYNSNFFGLSAGQDANNSYASNFFGVYAGLNATNANDSNFLGQSAGEDATTAYLSTFIGQFAGKQAATANNSIFIGQNAGLADTVNNSTPGSSSILIGDNTSTGGYSNSVAIGANAANSFSNQLKFADNLINLSIAGVNYTLPTAQATVSGQVLTNNGSGNLTWSNVSGASALGCSVSGTNLCLGSGALSSNTFGFQNTALGINSLTSNTNGQYNTAVGGSALNFNTSGALNSAFGNSAMYSNVNGSNNSAFGAQALAILTSGSGNSVLGANAGYNLTNGSNNIAIGDLTNFASTTGSNQLNIGNWIYGNNGNIGIGTNNPGNKLEVTSSASSTSGLRFTNLLSTSATTTANGKMLSVNSSGDVILVDNIVAGPVLTTNTLSFSTTTGILTGNVNGVNATTSLAAIISPITVRNTNSLFSTGLSGTGAGSSVTRSIFLGENAGANTTNSDGSNFLGFNAGQNATGAYQSNFLGENAGAGATNAFFSNFFGVQAGLNASSANDSNFFGQSAGENATGALGSNFFGAFAGQGASSAYSSNFFGPYAGAGATNARNSIFMGDTSGEYATNALQSIFLGVSAGRVAVNAANSIFIGNGAGNNDTVNNTLSDSSILIGDNTNTGGFSNSIAIGAGAVNTAANQFLVNASTTNFSFRGVNYIFPSAQGATGTVLTNNGTGLLSWIPGGAASTSTSAWSLFGNAGTDGGLTNFIGTTDAQNLSFRTNNIEKLNLSQAGRLNFTNLNQNLFLDGGNEAITGSSNIGLGFGSLLNNTTGGANISIGENSLTNNTTGFSNVALGQSTLLLNIIGKTNTAVGQGAGLQSTGDSNTFIGYAAGSTLASGDNNIAIGQQTSFANLNGSNQLTIGNWIYGDNGNIGIGNSAPAQALDVSGAIQFTRALMPGGNAGNTGEVLLSQGAGIPPIWVATSSLGITGGTSTSPITVQNGNSLFATGLTNPAGPGSLATAAIFIGEGAGDSATNANNSNFIGNYAGFLATGANNSNFIGGSAGNQASNAIYANFMGQQAGYLATNASYSNFFGLSAGDNATNAEHSNFMGVNAGKSASNASFSNFFGNGAGDSANNASNSNFLGQSSGKNAASAFSSNFIGDSAGFGAVSADNSNFLGAAAGYGATKARNSNFFGANAGINSFDANNSIFIGNGTGANDSVNNTVNGGTSILIGDNASTGGFSNSIGLGAGAINTAANQFLVNASTTNFSFRGVNYVMPSAQGATGTVLTNDGLGGLTWVSAGAASTSTNAWNITGNAGTDGGINNFIGTTDNQDVVFKRNNITFGRLGGNSSNSGIFFGNGAGSLGGSQAATNFFGVDAGRGATGANFSNFFGQLTGAGATNAINSNFFGQRAGLNSVNAEYSYFAGVRAGENAPNASRSIFIGENAGFNDTVDNFSNFGTSIAIGYGANTGGFSNSIALGAGAANTATNQFTLGPNYTKLNLVGIDYTLPTFLGATGTVLTNTGGGVLDWTVAGGVSPIIIENGTSLFATGLPNPAGDSSLATSSIFLGNFAGDSATDASRSNFFGEGAGRSANNAADSNFLGYVAGDGATNAFSSNFFGPAAGITAVNANNSNFLGQSAGFGATNANNSNFFGTNTGYNASNANNSNFLGQLAGNGAVAANFSNFIGAASGDGASGANNSNFIGASAGSNANNSYESTFIGRSAGDSAGTANNSIFIGSFAGLTDSVNNSGGGKSSILIGDFTSTGGFSNSIAIGANTVNTATNQFTVGPSYTDFNFRGVNYVMPSAQATTSGQVLTNDGLGGLTWTSVIGGSGTTTIDTNFATTDLTATGNRTHNFASNSLTLNNVGIYQLASFGAHNISSVGNMNYTAARFNLQSIAPNSSGLRFVNLNASNTAVMSTDKFLTVNSLGDVVLATSTNIISSSTIASNFGFINNGNSFGTLASLGTNDNQDLVIKTNNTEQIRVLANGSVGFGTNTPFTDFHIRKLGSVGTLVDAGSVLGGNATSDLQVTNASGSTLFSRLAVNGVTNEINFSASAGANRLNISNGSSILTFKNGGIGVNNLNPNNIFEVTATSSNASGLRFTNLTSVNLAATATDKFLTVDAFGDVILATSTIAVSPITVQNVSSLFSTGLSGTGAGSVAVRAVFLGENAGQNATNANNSVFLGRNAGRNAVSATNAYIFGNGAGDGATNAFNSNFFGNGAGQNATNANNSNFYGSVAGLGATNASFSNFIGSNAGFNAANATSSNFFGRDAGNVASSANNSNFFGENAGRSATSARFSNFFGLNAGRSAVNASNSTFMGQNAGFNAFFANNSIFIGSSAGNTDTVNNSTPGFSSILIGDNTNTGGFSNSIALGKSAVNTATNQFLVGPAYTDFNFRGVNYVMPATQGATGTVLNNDGLGGLTWVSGAAAISSSTIAANLGFINNGNSFGSLASLGTNDNFALGFKTNNTERFRLTNTGKMLWNGAPDNGADQNTLANFYNSVSGQQSTIKITNDTTGNTTLDGLSIGVGAGVPHAFVTNQENAQLVFGTNGQFKMYFDPNGNVGVNTGLATAPGNTFEIKQGIAGNSGLRFTNLLSTSATSTSNGKVLTVSTLGDVILVDAPSGSSGWSLTGNAGTNPNTNFIGTTDANALTFKVNNVLAGSLQNVSKNIFFGENAGVSIASGTANTYNVGIGYQAMGTTSSMFSINNIAIGYQSLLNGTNASHNTAIGYQSMLNSNLSTNNVANGSFTLTNNVTGSNNVAVGYNSMFNNIVGSANTAVGYQSMFNSTGNQNTAVGFFAMSANTTGNSNSAFGRQALGNNTTGTENTAIGYQAGLTQTAGDNNIFLGRSATVASTTGSNQLSIGNTIFGTNLSLATSKIGIGTNNPGNKFEINSTIAGNAGLRFTNLLSSSATTTGNGKVLTVNASGDVVLADDVGINSLIANNGLTLASNNVKLGGTLTQNTILDGALTNGITFSNMNLSLDNTNAAGTRGIIKLGSTRFISSAGSFNAFVGVDSGNSTVTGSANVGFGVNALNLLTTGTYNTAIGGQTLTQNTTGEGNTAIGGGALNQSTTGRYNIAIGYATGINLDTGSNNILLGNEANAPLNSTNNFMSLGNAIFATGLSTSTILSTTTKIGIGTLTPTEKLTVIGNGIFFGTGTTCTIGNGTGATLCSSDERLKNEIATSTSDLENIMKLRPVTYKWNANLNRSSSTQLGLIAQEVEKVYPGFVSTVYDGMKGVDYAALVSPLIGAVQELAKKIEAMAIKFTTKEIVTEKLCVGNTCVTETQLQNLLNQNIQNNQNNNNLPPVGNPPPTNPPSSDPAPDSNTDPVVDTNVTITTP
jgi:trimeric autotransporter adhesin